MSTLVITPIPKMGLAPDAICSHHRDTEGHSSLSRITTRLYVMSACGGEKMAHC